MLWRLWLGEAVIPPANGVIACAIREKAKAAIGPKSDNAIYWRPTKLNHTDVATTTLILFHKLINDLQIIELNA